MNNPDLPREDERGAVGLASIQALAPGFYAWAVTVLPAAWSRASGPTAKLCALIAALSLALSIVAERRFAQAGRFAGVWGFVLFSAFVWLLVPTSMGPFRLDPWRAVAGMLGWGLFAFVVAAPSTRSRIEPTEAPLPPRTKVFRTDALYALCAIAVAVVLQFIAWSVASPERALLIRVVTLGAGLIIIGTSALLVAARYDRPAFRAPKRRPLLRSAAITVILLLLLVAVGAIFGVRLPD